MNDYPLKESDVVEIQEPSQVWPPQPETVPDAAEATVLTGEPLDLTGTQINIRQCSCCDASHENLQVFEFTKPNGAYTHWYICPTLSEPVSIAIVSTKSGEGLELNGPICQAIADAQLSGQFMVAVFYIDENRLLQMRRTSVKFPVADYMPSDKGKGCLGLLKESLEKEVGPMQPAEMKPAMPPLMRSMLGKIMPGSQPNGQ